MVDDSLSEIHGFRITPGTSIDFDDARYISPTAHFGSLPKISVVAFLFSEFTELDKDRKLQAVKTCSFVKAFVLILDFNDTPDQTDTVAPEQLPLLIGAATVYDEAATWTWDSWKTPDGWDSLRGAVDNLGIYNTTLTAGQVARLYQMQKPR